MKSSNRADGWLTGRICFNREDKRLIIKRPRSGFGYTMNWGNKWTFPFPKGIVRCIIKAVKEVDFFEYNGADTSTGFRTSEITPIYGR